MVHYWLIPKIFIIMKWNQNKCEKICFQVLFHKHAKHIQLPGVFMAICYKPNVILKSQHCVPRSISIVFQINPNAKEFRLKIFKEFFFIFRLSLKCLYPKLQGKKALILFLWRFLLRFLTNEFIWTKRARNISFYLRFQFSLLW